MKQIFFVLFAVLSAANANAQCSSGQVLVCTNAINYTYDAVGNRIARSQYCYCAAPPPNRLAGPAKDSTATANTASTSAVESPYSESVGVSAAISPPREGQGEAATIAQIYPNPTTTEVTVTFTAEVQNATLQVSNQLGQQVATYKVSGNQTTIDLSNQATGIYLLTLLQNQTAIATQRVVKTD